MRNVSHHRTRSFSMGGDYMNNTMIKVGGVAIKSPSVFKWGLMDNSASDAGRVQDSNDTMYKNRTSQKRKIDLAWNFPTKEETATLLQAFNPEYITVTYPDALTGQDRTAEFYVGDRSAPMKIWTVGNKRYEQLSFNIIER